MALADEKLYKLQKRRSLVYVKSVEKDMEMYIVAAKNSQAYYS